MFAPTLDHEGGAFFFPVFHNRRGDLMLAPTSTHGGDASFGTPVPNGRSQKGGRAGKFMGGVGGIPPHEKHLPKVGGCWRGLCPPHASREATT